MFHKFKWFPQPCLYCDYTCTSTKDYFSHLSAWHLHDVTQTEAGLKRVKAGMLLWSTVILCICIALYKLM